MKIHTSQSYLCTKSERGNHVKLYGIQGGDWRQLMWLDKGQIKPD